ncbi:Receptor-like kinase [Quillaja saponaria]|uniref:non-specific serine/threonine protein kinase n=1 Tax=Quillaja saponaria TaxID=32244 RepID=A0AAD7KR45_QUISA|nr:Receptor-like kinase [Quillaja saponaria]
MSSSPKTAPTPDTPSSPDAPPPSKSSSSPPSDAPPPEKSSSPPPPSDSSPPPQSSSSPPAPSGNSSPPPPSSKNNSSTPPSPNQGSLSPPPPRSSNTSEAFSPPPPPPPPPPVGHKSPPSSHKSPDTSTPSTENGGSGNKANQALVGVVLGVGLFVLALIVICVICTRKKKRKNDHMQYYGNPSKGNDYYNSGQHPNWPNGPHGAEHVVRLPQQPSGMASANGGWGAPPPPPLVSGDMSTNFSQPPLPPPSPNMALGFNQSTFTYDELAAATGGFAQANLLGQGGFGYVHKGILPNGKEVAVKSLKSGSGQGEREFQAEVDIISRVHHRHLVSLVGYCIAGGQRMLVYEFVPNKTMEYHLHGKGLPTMDWGTRLRIAVGSAKGLAYLHEDCHPRIIHRDIKSANILIDDNFEAKVADFGLAKLSSDNNTHVSTRVMGTFGYLAPEYASSGKLTEKSDVFSFGVMLLELISGKRPVDSTSSMEYDSLVDWARPLLNRALEEGNYTELVDPFLENNYNAQEMARMVACAAASIRHSGRKRPKMSQIVRALEGDVSLDDLNEGTRPGQSSIYSSSNGSSDYDTNAYNSDMQKFRKMALSSKEFVSETSSGDSRELGH